MISENTRVLVQGMTGKEGRRSTESMLDSGITVSCGVTPGKGGQEVERLPVFNSVAEAMEHDPKINASVLYVPPMHVFSAAMEAMKANIPLIVIIAENVPVKDAARLIEYAREHDIKLVGPSSVGILNTRVGKIGSIGYPHEGSAFSKGNVAILSKSGGMTAETARILTQEGLGQSIAIGIGGDVLIGTTFTDMLVELESDKNTTAIVMFGEFGGTYEEELADAVKSGAISKPIVAFISGQFAEMIPRNLALGHAGAIIQKQHTAKQKKAALKEAGVIVADYHYEIPALVKQALER